MKKLYTFKDYVDYGRIQESFGFWKGFILGLIIGVGMTAIFIIQVLGR